MVAGMYPIIALWAHMRARSTAFLRMMLERGDTFVIHEPLVTLADHGATTIPDGRGGERTVKSERELFAGLRELAVIRPVFFKDTVEHRYSYLFDHSEDISDIVHTFILRDPHATINSVFNMKPNIVSAQIGYEHLWEIFALSRTLSHRPPVIVQADQLIRSPELVVEEYCRKVGLPFIPEALFWLPGKQPVWEKTQRWHEDVSQSSGFQAFDNRYDVTVDNNRLLAGFYRYHSMFYGKFLEQEARDSCPDHCNG